MSSITLCLICNDGTVWNADISLVKLGQNKKIQVQCSMYTNAKYIMNLSLQRIFES